MIAARVAGVPMPGVLHRLAQLLVVDELAGGLHRAEQRARRCSGAAAWSPWRATPTSRRQRRSPWLEPWAAAVVVDLVLVDAVSATFGSSAAASVDAAPAGDQQDLAARAEDVPLDRRLDARVLEHRLRVEGGEEAADHEVIDAAVVGVHLLDRVLGAGRDDRVVVCDLAVVDHARQRQQVEPRDVGRGVAVFGARADQLGRRLDLARHVGRQEARVGARVGQRLVLLVEPLGGPERAPRGEAEAGVGVALERGQVVEHRRLLGDCSRFSTLVISPARSRTAATIASASRLGRRAAAWSRRGSGRRSGARRSSEGSKRASISQ